MFPHANESTHRSFRITCGRIDEDTCHRCSRIFRDVEALAQRGRTVAAFKGEAVDKQVSDCVQENISRANAAVAEGARAAGAEVTLARAEDATPAHTLAADALILGSGVHMAGMESAMSAFFASGP